MNKRKIIYKLFSYIVIAVIFWFLGKNLFNNWQEIKGYDFSFNYFYLLLSFLFLIASLLWQGIVWNKILRFLEPEKILSNLKALKFFVYSCMGRYLPGKAWMYMARVYFGAKEGISKKILTISVGYEVILTIASAFLFSAVLLSMVFGYMFGNFYFIPIIITVVGLILVHPKIINYVYCFLPERFRIVNLSIGDFLSYKNIIKVVLYYFIVYSFSGAGLFFLIRSVIFLPFRDIIGVAGIHVLASTLGTIAVFAPGGLGVREGFLVLFLKYYLPAGLTVLIAFISRIWTVLGDILMALVFFIYFKFKKE